MDNNIQKIEHLYQNKGYNLTPQRKAITSELLKSKKRHLSCSEIYKLVKDNEESVGLATVYRAIAILEEIGVLKKAYIADEKSIKYEICTYFGYKNHFHLICKKCGSVIEVKDKGMDKLSEQVMDKYKFRVTEQRTNFFGICDDCSRKQVLSKRLLYFFILLFASKRTKSEIYLSRGVSSLYLYIRKRLAGLIIVLIGVTVLSFIFSNISTVDPAEALARRTMLKYIWLFYRFYLLFL